MTPASLEEKCLGIGRAIEGFDHIAVAFSGGVDSTFVAWFILEKLGKRVTAFFADTVFVSAAERENALRTAERLGLPLEVIALNPLDSALVRANPVDRCYHCKKEVFSRILAGAKQSGCHAVVDGSHAGDAGGYRPGKKALAELGIISPLAAAGLVKEEIRRLSREAGLANWNKPSQSCLATRVPYGSPLSFELLQRIEKAEDILHGFGCAQVRVRCHGDLARIEAEEPDFAAIFALETCKEILRRFAALGFAHVTLDLAGFRSGSWDEGRKTDDR
ncbi:MAG: ATP-dependent sacrificial sulfur transferase LarE [Syntrophobacteraceae bacterium]